MEAEHPSPYYSCLAYLLYSSPLPVRSESPVDEDDGDCQWSFEENQLFEKCLALFDHGSPDFFERIAWNVPGKSVRQIRRYYEALVEDLNMIDAGRIQVPDYDHAGSTDDDEDNGDDHEKEVPRTQLLSSEGRFNHKQQRKRGVAWTKEEHESFLKGLALYGKGDWKSISRHCVITRTPSQVASHAQKHFLRLQRSSARAAAPRGRVPASVPSTGQDASVTSTSTTVHPSPRVVPVAPSTMASMEYGTSVHAPFPYGVQI